MLALVQPAASVAVAVSVCVPAAGEYPVTAQPAIPDVGSLALQLTPAALGIAVVR